MTDNLCDQCEYEFATCKAYNPKFSIPLDDVIECDAYSGPLDVNESNPNLN